MNEKLSIQDLIDLLAEKHGMDKENAEVFVKEFFLLIEQALESDRYVKIKGLGVFKLIDVESRESVNVNTGERFKIEGHTKVSFTPDPSLRDLINKPFSHFETVLLNESTVLDDTPVENAEEDADDPGESIETTENTGGTDSAEPAEAISGKVIAAEVSGSNPETIAIAGDVDGVPLGSEVVAGREKEEDGKPEAIGTVVIEQSCEQHSVSVEEPPVAAKELDTEVNDTEEPGTEEGIVEGGDIEESDTEKIGTERTAVEETIIEEPGEDVSVPEEEKKEIPSLSAEEIIAQEIRQASREQNGRLQPPVHPLDEKNRPEIPQAVSSAKSGKKAEKSPVPYLIAVIVIVLLLCGGAIAFIYFPDLFSSKKETLVTPEIARQVEPKVLPEPIVDTDTITKALQKDTVKAVTPAEPVKQKATEQVINNEATKPVNTIKSGTPVKPDSANFTITGTKTTYTLKEGETLTKIALRFYGTKDLWPYIVKYNRDVIKNPDNVPYGTKLKIPELVKK